MDLLTAVAHEIGHVLGFDHTDANNDVMEATLEVGERNLPLPANVDAYAMLDAMRSQSYAALAAAATDSFFALSGAAASPFEFDVAGAHVSSKDGSDRHFSPVRLDHSWKSVRDAERSLASAAYTPIVEDEINALDDIFGHYGNPQNDDRGLNVVGDDWKDLAAKIVAGKSLIHEDAQW